MKIGETELQKYKVAVEKKRTLYFFYLTKGIISQIAVLLQQNLL